MKFSKYERTDSIVDAVQITESNMPAICLLVGYKVTETTSPTTGTTYKKIILNTRKARSGKKTMAYVGDWLTRDMHGLYKVYSNTRFLERFIDPEQPH